MEKKCSGIWNRIRVFDTFKLKMLAVISMSIDHAGAVLMPECIWMRIIGRLAFPIYCFLLVQGFRNTYNIKKYIGRLALFAAVSEIPFNLAFYGAIIAKESRNVFFTLLLGLLLLELITLLRTYGKTISPVMNGALEGAAVLSFALAAEVLKSDYSFYGILMIYCFFLLENNFFMKLLFQALINIRLMGYIQGFALAAMLPVYLYNGSMGCKKYKYFFYWYYPVHLILIWFIAVSMS